MYKGLSKHSCIVESCRKTLPGMRRLRHTKVKIVGFDMVLPSLERPLKELGCWLQKSRMGVVLGLGQELS